MHAPQALQALTAAAIDYAGMYWPAEVSLDAALQNHAAYRHQDEAAMLGRLVLPAAKLGEITAEQIDRFGDRPLAVSLVATGGGDEKTFLANLRQDRGRIDEFEARHAGKAVVDVVEARLPASPDALLLALEGAQVFDRGIRVFYEAGATADWEGLWRRVIGGIYLYNQNQMVTVQGYPLAGFKLRCGGKTPQDYPTPEQVAFVIDYCRQLRVPLKFTAGLHHPLRHHNAQAGVDMHGFLNVFVAGVLAAVHNLSPATVAAIVNDRDPANFQLSDAGIQWRSWAATLDQIADARLKRLISFGSCSFDEPREDLAELGFLRRRI